jgi:hypothetical protein
MRFVVGQIVVEFVVAAPNKVICAVEILSGIQKTDVIVWFVVHFGFCFWFRFKSKQHLLKKQRGILIFSRRITE